MASEGAWGALIWILWSNGKRSGINIREGLVTRGFSRDFYDAQVDEGFVVHEWRYESAGW